MTRKHNSAWPGEDRVHPHIRRVGRQFHRLPSGFPPGAPVYDVKVHVPAGSTFDGPVIIGLITFGFGWGIARYFPGRALPAICTACPKALMYLATLAVAMMAARPSQRRKPPKSV